MDERIELLVTVVVVADGEADAREACADLAWQVGGSIVGATDCSAEEPGCRAVTILVRTEETVTQNLAGALARSVRRFIRELGPAFTVPRVACEPPTAWTVLDDPESLAPLVPKAERLLIEAWYGDPYRSGGDEPDAGSADADSDQWPPDVSSRLTLRVAVATMGSAGAEWQARAVASRITRSATLASVEDDNGVLTVAVDLGSAGVPPGQAVLTAASALDRPGWSTVRWEGDVAITRWIAKPRPASGIVQLELTAGPNGHDGARHRAQ